MTPGGENTAVAEEDAAVASTTATETGNPVEALPDSDPESVSAKPEAEWRPEVTDEMTSERYVKPEMAYDEDSTGEPPSVENLRDASKMFEKESAFEDAIFIDILPTVIKRKKHLVSMLFNFF